jgi:transposase
MLIIGCDYHPSMQQIAFLDSETGERGERRLMHRDGEAEKFYRGLQRRAVKVRVGMEATGYAHWFERLLGELGFELWIGEPAKIRARRVRKQKTDRRDAQLLLQLLQEEDGFPRVWMPSPENRDLRQLLWHRHRLVQMRTRIMNQLQAVALNEGLRRKRGVVEPGWAQAIGVVPAGSLGQPASAGPARAARPSEPHDRGVDGGGGEGRREAARGPTSDDSSRSRSADRACFRANHRDSAAFSLR